MFVSEDYNYRKSLTKIDLSGLESTSILVLSVNCLFWWWTRFWREETMRNFLLGTTTWKHLERKKEKKHVLEQIGSMSTLNFKEFLCICAQGPKKKTFIIMF